MASGSRLACWLSRLGLLVLLPLLGVLVIGPMGVGVEGEAEYKVAVALGLGIGVEEELGD